MCDSVKDAERIFWNIQVSIHLFAQSDIFYCDTAHLSIWENHHFHTMRWSYTPVAQQPFMLTSLKKFKATFLDSQEKDLMGTTGKGMNGYHRGK